MHAQMELGSLQSKYLASFNQLVSIHQRCVFNLAYRLLDNTQSAEDVVARSFMRMYQLYAPVDDHFIHLLLRTIVELCREALREPYRSPQLGHLHLTQPRQTNWSETAIQLLEFEERLVLLLSDIHGFTYQEIANIAGAPPHEVRARICQARQSLYVLSPAESQVLVLSEPARG